MEAHEIADLTRLLRKLSEHGLGTPHMPREVFRALRGVVAQPAVEVLATRTGRDVLLTPRHDADFQGHHLPGGFVGAGETLEAAADRIARRELGSAARLVRIVGHFTWVDHPYASPLSLLCLCELASPPTDGHFFDMDALPHDLLAQHRALLTSCWPAQP